ncbi:MAG: L,D-transpeptidase family protein [Chromatiales bacterium]
MLWILAATSAWGETFVLPPGGDNVVGALNVASVPANARVVDIAMTYDQGFQEVKIANPGIDMIVRNTHNTASEVILPSQYVLPDTPREGIVLNVPEMRLYYYPRPAVGEVPVVITHPVGIGREDWTTPHGVTKVVAKIKDPVWVPPESIRREHLRDWGEVLPRVVPAGLDNPMGAFALKLGFSGYYIHGTDARKVEGIGMRVTHGCIRLYPKDIESLFNLVTVGTPVRIINQPVKAGRLNGVLYLEAHPHLDEDPLASEDQYNNVVNQLISVVGEARSQIDWNQIRSAIALRNGIPVAIGQWFGDVPPEAAVPGVTSAENRNEVIEQVW